MKRKTTRATKATRKRTKTESERKSPRKPVRRTACPKCGHGHFLVAPFVVPELHYEFADNMDTIVTLEDHMRDDRDEITCDNCGHYGTWSEFDKI